MSKREREQIEYLACFFDDERDSGVLVNGDHVKMMKTFDSFYHILFFFFASLSRSQLFNCSGF